MVQFTIACNVSSNLIYSYLFHNFLPFNCIDNEVRISTEFLTSCCLENFSISKFYYLSNSVVIELDALWQCKLCKAILTLFVNGSLSDKEN